MQHTGLSRINRIWFVTVLAISSIWLPNAFAGSGDSAQIEILVTKSAMAEIASCNLLLDSLSSTLLDSPVARVALWSELFTNLKETGTSPEGIALLSQLISKFFDKNSQIQSLAHTSRDMYALYESQSLIGQRPLAVCIGDFNCKINQPSSSESGDSASFQFIPLNFQLVDLKDIKQLPERSGSVDQAAENGLLRQELLLLKPLEPATLPGTTVTLVKEGHDGVAVNSSPHGAIALALWMGHLARELTKYSTLKILSAWIKANALKIQRGGEPDSFFRNHVRFDHQGNVLIAKEFFFLLIYARSAETWTEVEARTLRALMGVQPAVIDAIAAQNSSHRSGTIKDLTSIVGTPFLQFFGVNQNSIYDIANKVIEIMQRTSRSSAN